MVAIQTLISSDHINRQVGSGFDVSLTEELRAIWREEEEVLVSSNCATMRTKSGRRSSVFVSRKASVNIRICDGTGRAGDFLPPGVLHHARTILRTE